MGFRDLKSPTGLQVHNDYLSDQSCNKGYVPSQTDVAVIEAVSSPSPVGLCHALHWYNYIKSYEKEKASRAGMKKVLGKYGPANGEDRRSGATDSEDDDDIDLFGFDEGEESTESKKQREEYPAEEYPTMNQHNSTFDSQYKSKKDKKKAAPVAKSFTLLDMKPCDTETNMAKLEEWH
uniref:elongation factor 1-beta-like n=1 Tax=Callithrix jacchus TaxID=9483 RepID=UPI00159D0282|nr:elongation factor 1-beta-like [Callithrix jacchus]